MKAVNQVTVLSVVLCTFALALADINTVRKEALNKVDSYVNEIKRIADETSVEVTKREENIKIIAKHEKEFGDGIIDNTNFQVKKTAVSAYMMAKLIGSKNDVFRCIETRERDSLDEISKYYNQKFLDPGRDYESRAEQHQRNVIKAWKDDYYTASNQYGDIYKRTVNDIKNSNSESNIASLVKRFEDTSRQMAEIITNIHPNMAKIHIEVLQTFDQLVKNVQDYSKSRVEQTTKDIQGCFPRFYQSSAFLPRTVA